MIERVLTPVEVPSRTSGRRALIVAVGAIVVAALAALGAGLATGLSHDHHRAHGTD